MYNEAFWKNKNVFITGHTGFKGAWLCKILIKAGANVTGFALMPNTTPSLFSALNLQNNMRSIIGDVRNLSQLQLAFEQSNPEIVFHLAAQPIVRESYKNPHETYETNVMGTVNVLECVRLSQTVKSFLNVTTDKVYHNNEWEYGYRESDPLDGYDPYSNSKSCSELVTHSYKNSFLSGLNISVSTARAGNVIGGGDFAKDRIIPDCIRAIEKNEKIIIRNPNSTRPYQHVLEPLFAYLMIAEKQYDNIKYANWYNVGPDDCDCVTTGKLATTVCNYWQNKASWVDVSEKNAPHEASFLKLDCSRIKSILNWNPVWHIDDAVKYTCQWYKAFIKGEDVNALMEEQINAYLEGM